jgi:hypothetical protein
MTARGRNKVADYVDAVREKDRLKCPASDDLQLTRYDAWGLRIVSYLTRPSGELSRLT